MLTILVLHQKEVTRFVQFLFPYSFVGSPQKTIHTGRERNDTPCTFFSMLKLWNKFITQHNKINIQRYCNFDELRVSIQLWTENKIFHDITEKNSKWFRIYNFFFANR
jgi:hypothetical protein